MVKPNAYLTNDERLQIVAYLAGKKQIYLKAIYQMCHTIHHKTGELTLVAWLKKHNLYFNYNLNIIWCSLFSQMSFW